MKRVAQNDRKKVYRFFPLVFWTSCAKCGQEFRRERGWKFETGPYTFSPTVGFVGLKHYLCSACAPSRESAQKFAEDHILSRPTPPPAPPPPPAAPYRHCCG